MKKMNLKRIADRAADKKGASAVTSLIIVFVCVIIFAFIFQLYSFYTISSNIHSCFKRSIKTITAMNEINIYENLRENVLELSEEDIERLITLDELKEAVSSELGLSEKGSALVREKSGDGYSYRIDDLEFDHTYEDATGTLRFDVSGKIEVPLGVFGGNAVKITLDLDVTSVYASKLRADR